MDVGIPRERLHQERRVALTPAAAGVLVQAGHRVFVERSAGRSSRFGDEEYVAAGATLAYDGEEIYRRADLVLAVAAPRVEEYSLLREGQILICFLLPAVAPAEGFRLLLERGVSAIAMELIEDAEGDVPVLRSMSEIAGPMSIHIAAHLLESSSGGRGILLGGAPGITPASVVILGAGVVGTYAARTAMANGAEVTVLDRDVRRLRHIYETLPGSATTLRAEQHLVARAVGFADVVVGAVMVRAGRTPHLVSESMVRTMKPGAVVVDVSVDQGGCLETSRPTTLAEPTYTYENVVHYAVPNMTANVARTASYALSNACLPYVTHIAARGLGSACHADPGLSRGLVTAAGRCVHPRVAESFGVEAFDALDVLAAEGRAR